MDKARLFESWKIRLEEARRQALQRQQEARSGMRVDAGHRPANRGERASVTSQGYLAEGLNQRLSALEDALGLMARVEPTPREQVMIGALTKVESESGESLWFVVLPGGDASPLESEGQVLTVLSQSAPFVRCFLGARVGDEIEVEIPNRKGFWSVEEIV